MPGGKGKSVGGKATGAKDSGTKAQKSHSAKAGLQVRGVHSVEHICRVKRVVEQDSSLIDDTVYCGCASPDTNVTRDASHTDVQEDRMTNACTPVPLRSSEAIPQEQHSEQDARWRQR